MKQIYIGIGFIVFGILVGNMGLTSAGVGVALPMIPLGIYLIVRGIKNKDSYTKEFSFERTPLGKISLAIILIIVAFSVGGSFLISLVLFASALYLIYNVFKNKNYFTKKNPQSPQ